LFFPHSKHHTPASYSGCPAFDSRSRRQAILIEVSVVILSSSWLIPEYRIPYGATVLEEPWPPLIPE
jgi:hypothetical protein